MLAMLMMLPPPAAAIEPTNALQMAYSPTMSPAAERRQASMVWVSKLPLFASPTRALLTRISTRTKRSSTSRWNRAIESTSPMSSCMPWTSAPVRAAREAACSRLRASEREAVITRAPASARASAMLLPNSGPAPAVTTAVLPSSENRSSIPIAP